MRLRRVAEIATLVVAGLVVSAGAAERPKVVRGKMTIESHRMVINHARTAQNPAKRVSRLMPVDVTVYRPNDGLKHPAVVYLHGGSMSFADPLMDRFHVELASRGLVVLAPHYLLDGTGWPHWHESALNTVTLAASLPSVDPDHIGMAGLSMGGQIGLSTAARDPRIKAVAEFFTAWPGTLPDEPVAKLPPVLLLNGTADPIIPFADALVLDQILKEHKLPFERHVYEGLGHGFGTPSSFKDGVARTAAFFGGRVDEPAPARKPNGATLTGPDQVEPTDDEFGESEIEVIVPPAVASPTLIITKKYPRRLLVKKPPATLSTASRSRTSGH